MRVSLIDPALFTFPYDRMLALGLQQAGHEVVLHGRALRPGEGDRAGITLAPTFHRTTRFSDASLPQPVRLALKGVDHVRSMAGLLARLRRERPDVIHFQWLPLPAIDSLFLPMFRHIAPLVLTVHDSNPFNGNPSSRLQYLGATYCYRFFDRLIVHTEQCRLRVLARGLPAERVVRVPHGLLGEARPAPIPDLAAHSANTPPTTVGDQMVFLLFGQLKAYKGIDTLIEAFAQLPEALREKAQLRVVGRPYMDLAPLLDLAERRGVASQLSLEPRFVAEEEIPSLFGPNTVAVFPYREIEASGVLTLAMVHGRPVIASRIGTFAELLEDGVHGVLVPPAAPEALASAMQRMITDRDFVGRCAANMGTLVETIPSWDTIGQRTAAVYASVPSLSAQLGYAEKFGA